MSIDQLKLLLSDGGIAPGNVPRLAEVCEGWFMTQPGLTPFVFRSIFRELADEWSDPQAIPTAVYSPFEEKLLPELTRLSNLLPAHPQGLPVRDLENLVRVFRDCTSTARQAGSS